MKMLLTLDRFKELLKKCKIVFADKNDVAQNDKDLDDYVLNITQEWYNTNLALDTTDANSSPEDLEAGAEPESNTN